jgi:hypothetical protein
MHGKEWAKYRIKQQCNKGVQSPTVNFYITAEQLNIYLEGKGTLEAPYGKFEVYCPRKNRKGGKR